MQTTLRKTGDGHLGYSSDVRIELHTGQGVLSPGQTASDFLLFDEPTAIETSVARLVIYVDDVPQETIVEILPYDAPARRVPVRIVP